MPARSKKQQMAAGAALAAKRGERSKQSLKGASRQMAESMSERQLREFAHTSAEGERRIWGSRRAPLTPPSPRADASPSIRSAPAPVRAAC